MNVVKAAEEQQISREHQVEQRGDGAREPAHVTEHRGAQDETRHHAQEIHAAERDGREADRAPGFDGA